MTGDLRHALEELTRELRARIHTTPSARRENPWVPGGEFTDGKLMTALVVAENLLAQPEPNERTESGS